MNLLVKIGSATIDVRDISVLWQPSVDRNDPSHLWKVGAITKTGTKAYETFESRDAAKDFYVHILSTWTEVTEVDVAAREPTTGSQQT